MNWFKLVKHDLHDGILCKRTLLPFAQFFLFCAVCHAELGQLSSDLTLIDYLIFFFRGTKATSLVQGLKEFQIPIIWLQGTGCLMYLCLDYPIKDLTKTGQQILIRYNSKKGWFASKCIWNITYTIIYFCSSIIAALLFTLLTDGNIVFRNTPSITMLYTESFSPIILSNKEIIISVFCAPLFTLAALNILQMLLTFVIKPIYAFLYVVSSLMLTTYLESSFILGNGAMIIRSVRITGKSSGVSPDVVIALSCFIIVLCVLVGLRYFRKYDVLDYEE